MWWLEKYEYLTGEDLRYEPGVVLKANFQYSPLGKVFNKGLEGSDKKKEFWKVIEGKIEEQLKTIKNEVE